MTWNLYDQSVQTIYPDRSSGYWRVKPDAEIASVYARFTRSFDAELGCVNTWGPDDRLCGILVAGHSVWLLRIHNGGRDSRGRPQRWVLAAYGDTLRKGTGIDLAAWMQDPAWLFTGVVPADVPLPQRAYDIPLVDCDRNDWRSAPNDVTTLESAQVTLNAWLAAPHRKKSGSVFFSTVGGQFSVTGADFPYGPLPAPPPPPPIVSRPPPRPTDSYPRADYGRAETTERADNRPSLRIWLYLILSLTLNVVLVTELVKKGCAKEKADEQPSVAIEVRQIHDVGACSNTVPGASGTNGTESDESVNKNDNTFNNDSNRATNGRNNGKQSEAERKDLHPLTPKFPWSQTAKDEQEKQQSHEYERDDRKRSGEHSRDSGRARDRDHRAGRLRQDGVPGGAGAGDAGQRRAPVP